MRQKRICALLVTLLVCLPGMALENTNDSKSNNIVHNAFECTIKWGSIHAAAETPRQPQTGEVFQGFVLNQIHNGIAYVEYIQKDADVVIIPPSLEGLPFPFENIEFRVNQTSRLVLSEGITRAGGRQFSDVTTKELVLPSTLREIGEYAFAFIRGLTTLTIPEGVTTIEDSAFILGSMKSVDLPSTLKTIDPGAFYSCSSLRWINVHPDNPYFSSVDGVLYSKDQKTLYCFPGGYGERFTIPDTTEAIAEKAFGHNLDLHTLTIGEGMRVLNTLVFLDCPALRVIRLSKTVETIQENALPLGQLTALEVPEENPFFRNVNGTVYGIADASLIFHPRGTDISYSVLPETKRIGALAFSGDELLMSVSLPLGVEEIDFFAFRSCTALENISLPLTLTHIGNYAFSDCIALERIALPPGLLEIGAGAFSNCARLSLIALPAGIREISETAFDFSPQLTITAPVGSVGSMHAREGKTMEELLHGDPTEAASMVTDPVTVGIVNNPGTDDLLPMYATASTDTMIGKHPNGTTMIIRSDWGEWLNVIVGDMEGFVKAEGLMRNEAFYTLYRPLTVEVPVGPVELKSAPLAMEAYVDRLDGGIRLPVIAACGTWYQVLWNGESAYVPTNLATVVQYEDLSGGGPYGVVENPNARDRLHLRDKPSRDGNSIQRFFNGTQVEILDQQGDWYHVRVAGIEGYMMANFVRPVSNEV